LNTYSFGLTGPSAARNSSLQTAIDELMANTSLWSHPDWVDRLADTSDSCFSRAIQWVLDLIYPRTDRLCENRPMGYLEHGSYLGRHHPAHAETVAETKHGSPNTDDEDVPEYLRSHMAQPKENEWDTDSLHHMRWDWILAEMIFAFEKKAQDDWASEFHSGEIDWEWVPIDDGNEVPKGEHRFYQMKDGPKHTHVYDAEGAKKVQERITNGFRLFGKYYENLWD
jgi:hypothetical protein